VNYENSEGVLTARYCVEDKRELGLVIGIGGKNIKHWEMLYLCLIRLEGKTIFVTGRHDNVKAVIKCASEIIQNNKFKYVTSYNEYLPIFVFPQYREKLTQIEKLCDLKVTLKFAPKLTKKSAKTQEKPRPVKNKNSVELRDGIILCGTEAAISSCEEQLSQFFGQFNIKTYEIPFNVYETIKNPKSKLLQKLRELSKGYLEITPYWGRAEVKVITKIESIDLIKQELEKIKENHKVSVIKIDSQFAANKLVGKNGSNLANIRSQCPGTKITLSLSSELIITGSQSQIQKATKLSKESLGRLK